MKTKRFFLGVLAVTAAFSMADAAADSKPRRLAATHPAWKAECGSCHVAYPPGLLSTDSWRRIMGGLERHFGTDASLDAATAREIAAFLESNSGRVRDGTSATSTPRITETPWFRHEHDEVEAAVWKRAGIKSAANCTACHTDTEAERGYRKRGIRIPRQ